MGTVVSAVESSGVVIQPNMKVHTTQHNTTQRNATQHNTAQRNTTQQNTTQRTLYTPSVPETITHRASSTAKTHTKHQKHQDKHVPHTRAVPLVTARKVPTTPARGSNSPTRRHGSRASKTDNTSATKKKPRRGRAATKKRKTCSLDTYYSCGWRQRSRRHR